MQIRKRKRRIRSFDTTLLLDGLQKSRIERLKESAKLFDRYKILTPYKFYPVAKSFGSFKEYERWKKKQRNPIYW